MKKYIYSSISLVILVVITVTAYYYLIRLPQDRATKLETQQQEAVKAQENAVKRKACMADQASLPANLRSSGTYVDCQALYP